MSAAGLNLAHQHEVSILGPQTIDCLLGIYMHVVDPLLPVTHSGAAALVISQGELALTIMGIDGEITPDVKANLSSLSV